MRSAPANEVSVHLFSHLLFSKPVAVQLISSTRTVTPSRSPNQRKSFRTQDSEGSHLLAYLQFED